MRLGDDGQGIRVITDQFVTLRRCHGDHVNIAYAEARLIQNQANMRSVDREGVLDTVMAFPNCSLIYS